MDQANENGRMPASWTMNEYGEWGPPVSKRDGLRGLLVIVVLGALVGLDWPRWLGWTH